jgi:hypothetical protein
MDKKFFLVQKVFDIPVASRVRFSFDESAVQKKQQQQQ